MLPEEHRMIYEMCRKFADEELAPNAHEWDKKHSFPKEAVTQLVRRLLRSFTGGYLHSAAQVDTRSEE